MRSTTLYIVTIHFLTRCIPKNVTKLWLPIGHNPTKRLSYRPSFLFWTFSYSLNVPWPPHPHISITSKYSSTCSYHLLDIYNFNLERSTRTSDAMAAANYEACIALIDEARTSSHASCHNPHIIQYDTDISLDAQDPNVVIVDGKDVPYELHYAQQMTHYLTLRSPSASPVLKTAIRAQRNLSSHSLFRSSSLLSLLVLFLPFNLSSLYQCPDWHL